MFSLVLVLLLGSFLSSASAEILAEFNATNPTKLGIEPHQMTPYTPNPDATLKVEGDYIVLRDSPFTTTTPPGETGTADHVKFVPLLNAPWSLPKDGKELRISMNASFQCAGTKENPFGINKNDMRLCYAGLVIVDFEFGHVVDFLVSNKKIYAYYEKMNFYGYDIPVADRKKDQFHDLQIAFNAKSKYIRWIVDGKEVFRYKSVGKRLNSDYQTLDLGGDAELSFPNSVSVGFGTFTLLDAYSTCKTNIKNGTLTKCPRPEDDQGLVRLQTTKDYYLFPGTDKPATFMSEGQKTSDRIWGQGATIMIDDLVISVEKAPK